MKAKTKNKLAKMQEVQTKKHIREKRKWIIKQLNYYHSLPSKPTSSNSTWFNFEAFQAADAFYEQKEQEWFNQKFYRNEASN